MAMTIRVSLPGYNALTDTDPRHFSLFADSDNVLIKEFARGAADAGTSNEITHGLGYIPFYIIMGKISTTKWAITNSYDPLGALWVNYATTNKIYFDPGASSHDNYKYYVFYDNFS